MRVIFPLPPLADVARKAGTATSNRAESAAYQRMLPRLSQLVSQTHELAGERHKELKVELDPVCETAGAAS